MNYFARRRIRKNLRLLLNHARHICNLREDVASPDSLRQVAEAKRRAREALRAADPDAMASSAKLLEKAVAAIVPQRSFPGLRDNIEMIAVAVAVAMAFRSYFIQPFKIPTSSMHPTLYGITYEPDSARLESFIKFPLALARWAVLGEWPVAVRAGTSGIVRVHEGQKREMTLLINDVPHIVYDGMRLRVAAGDRVIRGQILATGRRKAGDHILVNKVAWNFRAPSRGEIMVFKTDGIDHPQIKQNEHYVKRLVGLPGETLGISDPYLKINGARACDSKMIERIENCEPGYVGYKNAGMLADTPHQDIHLSPDEFYACGDNQLNSLDSRYWGPVPRKNLVGPAFFVYWPLSRRWGRAD